MHILKTLNPENAAEQEYLSYPVREAARAVVSDQDQNIALLFVSKENYYKLPGGGVESSEDHETALRRECQEEIGCNIDIISELGSIIEYRKFCSLKQISYCYTAKVKGEKGEPQLTQEEIDEGFQVIWLPYAKAVSLIPKTETHNLEGKDYIVPRDLAFLKAARSHQ